MKPILVLAFTIILPLILFGINTRLQPICNSYCPLIDNSIQSYQNSGISLPALSRVIENRNRNWHLSTINTSTDTEATGILTQSEKMILFYNINNPAQLDSVQILYWNSETDNYYYSNTKQYNYDASGELLLQIKNGNTIINDVNDYIELGYDNQGRLEYAGVYNWSENGFHLNYTNNFSYENNWLSQIIVVSYGFAEGHNWYSKFHFEHDSSGRLCSRVKSTSIDSLNWTLYSLWEYTYHPNDTSTGEDYTNYLGRHSLTDFLNPNAIYGMVSEIVYSSHINSEPGGWYEGNHDCYQYNENNQLYKIEYMYNYPEWDNAYRLNINYDYNGNVSATSYQNWLCNLSSWSTDLIRYDYTWEQFTANEDEYLPVSDLQVSAFPNPFRNDLQIKFHSDSKSVIKADVYNIKGQLVKSLGISKDQSFKWDGKDITGKDVCNGIYFIKAAQNGKTNTIKTVKVK